MEVEKKAKTPRVYPKIDEKHAAFSILVNNGVDKVVAAETLGYKGKTAYALQKRIEKKGGLDVASEKMVRLSHRVIRNCMQGKPWGKIETIKDSTALAAAQIIVDRHQPKNQENSPPPISFTKVVDLELCRMRPVESPCEELGPATPDLEIAPDEEPPVGTP